MMRNKKKKKGGGYHIDPSTIIVHDCVL